MYVLLIRRLQSPTNLFVIVDTSTRAKMQHALRTYSRTCSYFLTRCYARTTAPNLRGSNYGGSNNSSNNNGRNSISNKRANRNGSNGPVLNDAIRSLNSVRLVLECGKDGGVMSGFDAYSAARKAGLDIMQVSRTRDMAIVRLLNYEAYKVRQAELRDLKPVQDNYYSKKKNKSAVQQQKLKQVRLSPATDTGDRTMKVNQARKFLLDGHIVRVFMLFRRGHGVLRDQAEISLCEIARSLAPECGTLRNVDIDNIREHFRNRDAKNAPPGSDPDAAPAVPPPRSRKPLELFFDPLPKKQREKIVRLEALAAGHNLSQGDGDGDIKGKS